PNAVYPEADRNIMPLIEVAPHSQYRIRYGCELGFPTGKPQSDAAIQQQQRSHVACEHFASESDEQVAGGNPFERSQFEARTAACREPRGKPTGVRPDQRKKSAGNKRETVEARFHMPQPR